MQVLKDVGITLVAFYSQSANSNIVYHHEEGELYKCICIYISLYIDTYIQVCTSMYISVYLYIYEHVCMYVCV
jgi:hypothetical protein